MELETLKKSWESLDKRIQSTTSFNQKLVENIISSRVVTTVDRVKRLHTFYYIFLTIEILVLIAIFLGNPFDFSYKIQFLPYGLLLVGILLTFSNLLHQSKSFRKVSPGETIGTYLKNLVAAYEKNKRFEKLFGLTFLSIGLLVPFSFLPQKIDRLGLKGALIDISIMVAVTLVIYILAFWLGAFKDRNKMRLEKDLADWNELKALTEAM